MWISGPLTGIILIGIGLCTRVLPDRAGRTSRGEDVWWMLVFAILMVGLGGVWLATFPLPDSVANTTSDFSEYCSSVAAAVDGRWESWSPNRSRLSGLPAILLTPRFGTQDALLLNAFVGQGLMGAGLYLWGRCLHSPVAGVAAVLAACTFAPLAALGRMLTFYPMIVGTLTFATGLVGLAWRWPSVRTALAAGAGIGLALLVDLRGLLWAMPLLGLSVLRVVAVRRPGRTMTLLCALCFPIGVAWWLAPWAYPPQTTTLEVLGDLTKGWKDLVELRHVRPPATAADGYIWGRSPVYRIPHTLWWLADQGRRVPEELRTHPQTLRGLRQMITPLQSFVVGSAILAVIGLLRRPTRLIFLVGAAVPFAMAFEGAIAARFAGLRFLGNGMPFLAVFVGVAVATVSCGAVSARPPHDRRLRFRGGLALGFMALVVVGRIGSEISPLAKWRGLFHETDRGLLTACEAPAGAPTTPVLLYELP